VQAHLGNGISSHRTAYAAWHRCDYGEKNAEGFFVQLKLQVVRCCLLYPSLLHLHTHLGTQYATAKRGFPEEFNSTHATLATYY
jgi:hypothetical protein